MKNMIYMAALAAFFAPAAYAQSMGTGNTFDPARDEIGIVRDGTFEGYGTAGSVLQWVQDNIVFPDDEAVTGAAIAGNVLTLTMASGAAFTATLPDDADTTNSTLATAGGDLVLTDSDGNSVSVSAADLAALVDALITHPVDDDTALQAQADANTAAIAAHVAADGDTDATNELQTGDGVTITGDGSAGNPFVAVGDGTGVDDDATQTGAINSFAYNTATQQIGIDLTFDDGGTAAGSLSLPIETFVGIEDVGALTGADRGLDLPEALKPRQRAATIAEVNQANSQDVALSLWSLERVLTNRAVEGAAGARGVANTDGTQGYYSRFFVSTADNVAAQVAEARENNGAIVWYRISGAGETFDFGGSEYLGQRQALRVAKLSSVSEFEEVVVNFTAGISGIVRGSDGKINTTVPADQVVRMRSGEWLLMVGNGGGGWDAYHNYNLASGFRWRENEDSTVTAYGNLPVNAAAFPAFTTFPPFCSDNGSTYICTGGQF